MLRDSSKRFQRGKPGMPGREEAREEPMYFMKVKRTLGNDTGSSFGRELTCYEQWKRCCTLMGIRYACHCHLGQDGMDTVPQLRDLSTKG